MSILQNKCFAWSLSWLPAAVGSPALSAAQFAPESDRLTYRKTENVKITHENIPENVKS